MRKSAITDALAKAGYNTAEALLRQLATEAIDKHKGNVLRARPTFSKLVIEHDAAEALIDEALWYYLSSQAFVHASRAAFNDQITTAGAGNGSAGGRVYPEAHNVGATAESSISRPKPQPPMTLEDRLKLKATRKVSIFDTYRLSSNHLIARTPIHMLARIQTEHARDAALVKLLRARLSNADPQKEVADYMSEEAFKTLTEKAEEMANAGLS